MSYFAKVENGIVTRVIAIEQETLGIGLWGDPSQWRQTSYNTRGNVHYGQDGEPDGGVALRGNYAGIGYVYDSENDVFYPPQPFPSWTIDSATWTWTAPVARPTDGKSYIWDEPTTSWKEVEIPPAI